ncbi:MAG: hypothetical protein Q8N23_25855 [Archangium sp.]|nr:hypothetical protein [Archangium sp.]MDP3156126.1 hypothetical protein [Archangium sp.]MDP3571463.1 hypothetical protein [Archangium sp.]
MNAEQVMVSEQERSLELEVAGGHATRSTLGKLERLRKERQRASLGRLARLFDDYEFRDEMLFSARLRRRAGELVQCLDDPQWATVQLLDLASGSFPALEGKMGAFFNSLPQLHTVTRLQPRLLPEVPCPRITSVSLPAAPLDRLAAAFPGLRSLEFVDHLRDARAFWAHPFIDKVESVTVRSLTWSQGKLTTRAGLARDAFVEWVESGPPLTHMELSEDDILSAGELYGLRELLAAARRKGAEVILMPSSERGHAPQWSSY